MLRARAAKGIEEEVEQGVRIPVGRGFAGRIAAERRPIVIPDVDHGDVLNPLLREKGIRSLLGVPLLVEGRVIGVLHVGTLTPRDFTAADRDLLQLAADRAALAIDHAAAVRAAPRRRGPPAARCSRSSSPRSRGSSSRPATCRRAGREPRRRLVRPVPARAAARIGDRGRRRRRPRAAGGRADGPAAHRPARVRGRRARAGGGRRPRQPLMLVYLGPTTMTTLGYVDARPRATRRSSSSAPAIRRRS